MDTAKRVSSGTTYLLRNGAMSPIELKELNQLKCNMCCKCSGCVFVQLGNFFFLLYNLKVAVMGQRSGEILSLLYPKRPKLHPTPEVNYAIARSRSFKPNLLV